MGVVITLDEKSEGESGEAEVACTGLDSVFRAASFRVVGVDVLEK